MWTKNPLTWMCISLILASMGCNGSGNGSGGNGASSALGFAFPPSNFRLALTDKPLDGAQSVNVNVESVEVFVEKSGQQARVVLAQNLGMVDLLQLRNNVFQSLGVMSLPPGLVIHQVRMILGDGNNLVKSDGSTCNLATPSAQQSGVKLLFTPDLVIESGYSYAVGLDFDVDSSVVLEGNGGCLLKPVIKVKTVIRTAIEPITQPPADSGSTDADGSTGGSTGSTGSTGDSSGSGIEVFMPVGVPIETVPTSGTSDGSFTDTSTTSDPVVTTQSGLWTM